MSIIHGCLTGRAFQHITQQTDRHLRASRVPFQSEYSDNKHLEHFSTLPRIPKNILKAALEIEIEINRSACLKGPPNSTSGSEGRGQADPYRRSQGFPMNQICIPDNQEM